MAYMQQSHFQQIGRRDVHVTTRKFLYMNIIYIAQWLFGSNPEILHCSDVFANRQKLCYLDSIFKQTHVNFLPRKYDVIPQLRNSYA